MTTHRTSLGKNAENVVATYLTNKGYTVTAQNFSCKMGEVDIIAYKGTTLVFVEVKARINPLFNISEVITPSKQQKIIKTAHYYIFKQKYSNYTLRFDVALLAYHTTPVINQEQPIRTAEPTITYIENAFTGTQGYNI